MAEIETKIFYPEEDIIFIINLRTEESGRGSLLRTDVFLTKKRHAHTRVPLFDTVTAVSLQNKMLMKALRLLLKGPYFSI